MELTDRLQEVHHQVILINRELLDLIVRMKEEPAQLTKATIQLHKINSKLLDIRFSQNTMRKEKVYDPSMY